jgi:hypothetical protein
MNRKKADNSELIEKFIEAARAGDIMTIDELLEDDGKFEIEDSTFELVDGTKFQFLRWFNKKLEATKIVEVSYDQCIGCEFGQQVVIFNNGTFPRIPQDTQEKTKAGIVFITNETKINEIKICFSFLKTENPCVWDIISPEIVKLARQGYGEMASIEVYKERPNAPYRELL